MAMASPPTRRVVDVLEMLASRRDAAPRLSDVVRELGLNQATAFAILSELCSRGWVSRDPVNKSYALDQGAAKLGEAAARARPVTASLRSIAEGLATEMGYALSVSERSGETLTITAFIARRESTWSLSVGDRLPYAAPFGPAYAAWDPDDERESWIRRSGVRRTALKMQLRDYLAATRQRGYSVERMSSAAAHVIQLVAGVPVDKLSDSMRGHVNALLAEVTASAVADSPAGTAPLVGVIAAPVAPFGAPVVANLCVHPFEALNLKAIHRIGRRLTSEVAALT